MKKYTIDALMSDAHPCDEWDRDRVAALFAAHGRKTVTALDVLRCGDLTDRDAIYQCARMVDRRQRMWLAILAAEQALEWMPQAGVDCLDVCRRWLDGEATDEEMADARWAADAAAADAAAADEAAAAADEAAAAAARWAAADAAADEAAAAADAVLSSTRELWIAALGAEA